MTPIEYLAAMPRAKRKAERERLAKIAGVSYHAIRAWTEPDKTGKPRRRCKDAQTCLRLEKATRDMVRVADWNPTFAPLTN